VSCAAGLLKRYKAIILVDEGRADVYGGVDRPSLAAVGCAFAQDGFRSDDALQLCPRRRIRFPPWLRAKTSSRPLPHEQAAGADARLPPSDSHTELQTVALAGSPQVASPRQGSKDQGLRVLEGLGSNMSQMVRMRGLEPPRGCPHGDLNAARLPIPPHP